MHERKWGVSGVYVCRVGDVAGDAMLCVTGLFIVLVRIFEFQ